MRLGQLCGSTVGEVSVVDLWLDQMGQWPIRVPANAITPGQPGMPAADETCLEIPFRLFIAPRTQTAKWITSSTPPWVSGPRSTAVEHWHAALHDRTKLVPASLPPDIPASALTAELSPPKSVTFQARAVFSPDYQTNSEPPWERFYPGNLPLSHRARVRHKLVEQMAKGAGDGWIDAEHLILSPLGADASLSYMMQRTFRDILDKQLQGQSADKSSRLAIWKHRMVVGRDMFLLSAWTGFLMPLVFPALFVELTRRTFVSRRTGATVADETPESIGFGPPGAYLMTEYFILVPDPVKEFPKGADVFSRKMPIKKATMLDPRSPLLQVPADIDAPFVPLRLDGGAKVRWSIEFEDADGGRSRTDDACLLFAANVVQGDEVWKTQTAEVRRWQMPAATVALAPGLATLQAPATSSAAAEAHPLAHAEREPAARLAEVLQGQLGGNLDVVGLKTAFKSLGTSTASLSPEARAFAEGLDATTRRFVGNLTDRLGDARRQAEDVANLLVSQLAGGEKLVAGAVERTIAAGQKANASALGQKLREEIFRLGVPAQVIRDSLKGQTAAIAKLSAEAQAAMTQLDAETKRSIDAVVQELETEAAVAERVVENVLRQLARAEKASTNVEVHAIEFGSRRVAEMLGHARSILERLDQFNSQAEFETWLGQQTSLKTPELDTELGALWSGIAADWEARRAEAKTFFGGLAAEADCARAFLRDGYQPEMVAADVVVPALKAMGGTVGPQELRLLEAYAAKGLDKVSNSVFAGFTKAIDDGKAMADRIKCAVAAPAAQVAGLSRDLGALVGQGQEAIERLAHQADGFDLRGAIPDFKILGVLPFNKIVSAALSGAELPTINIVQVPDHIEQVWDWNARVQEINLGILAFVPSPKGPKGDTLRSGPIHLSIRMATRIDLPRPDQAAGGAPPRGKVQLNGILSYWNRAAKKAIVLEDGEPGYAFAISILGLININFIDLSFDASYDVGQSPQFRVKPRLGQIDFLPPLDFVKQLQDALPLLGEGFKVVQDAARIGITYGFQLPNIAFGAFSMRNLAVGSSILFSLEGKPLRFSFNISSWKEPFELTVLCFGGRGFLRIDADTSGYRDLQGMLEFGGALSFDVGVASGGLYVMAGIYFRITGEQTTISGFVRAGGCLNVLGLIHASVEFLLMLGYVSGGGVTKLAGEASVTVSIDLFLTSFDVTVRMYKEFVGGGSSGGGTAALHRPGWARLVSLRTAEAATVRSPAASAPPAYFRRDPSSWHPATPVSGRFDELGTWNDQYWSQFAF